MKSIRIGWIHKNVDDPVELYSEIDEEGWEVRKVEVFRGGTLGFAGVAESSGSTDLGLEPFPSLDETALDPQFRPEAVTQAEFEPLWDLARSSGGVGSLWSFPESSHPIHSKAPGG
jgi:hypothetical protein